MEGTITVIDLVLGGSGNPFIGLISIGIIYPLFFILLTSLCLVVFYTRRYPLQSNVAIALMIWGFLVHISYIYEMLTYKGGSHHISLIISAGTYVLASLVFFVYCITAMQLKRLVIIKQLAMLIGPSLFLAFLLREIMLF